MRTQSIVRCRTGDLRPPTCLPAAPDKNPMFLEKRVYPGSSGKVYPLPFTDRIAETRVDRKWKAVWIENEFLRALVLPELGGRIHARQDKTNGYDLIYNQSVIKPGIHNLLLHMQQKVVGAAREARTLERRAAEHFRIAAALAPDYCFPARLEEIAILESAMRANPKDAGAPYYLGNLLYDRRRHNEAIRLWEKSARLDPDFSIVWRNLGIGYFNIRHNADRARTVYDKAFRVNPGDARLLYERDQLWKRLGAKPAKRLGELEKHPGLVQQRDDLSVELCALLNQTGRPVEAMQLLAKRNFQPWEGGEGGPLGQHVRTQLALGHAALQSAIGNRQSFKAGSRRLPPIFKARSRRFGSAGLAVIYIAMGFCYANGVKGLPVLLLVLAAIGCYAMSLAPVTWVIISEIFPNRIRGAAMSVSVTALWIACFILTYTFPLLNARLGAAGTFWVYGAICGLGFIFIQFKLPETKGKTLEQIEQEPSD